MLLISFYIKVDFSAPFDSDVVCPGSRYRKPFLMKPYYQFKKPHLLMKLEGLYFNKSFGIADVCKDKIQYMAQITFRLATDTMTVAVSSRRLSFFDKLSSFGKINLQFHHDLQW